MSTPSSKTRRGKDIESSRTSLPHTPSESEDKTLDAIGFLFEEIHVPSQEDPVPLIKSRLRHAAEHVTVGQFGNNLVYANSGGHGFLDQIEQMKSEISTLIAKDEQRAGQIDGHRRQIDEHQKHISSLESRVRHLVQTSEGYLSIRKRFLDVYKRDVKGIEELKGSKAIREGNVKAHEGDALGDALLFERDQRTDRSIYRELYGLEHQQVLDFHSKSDDGGMFLILNAHATMVAQGKTLPNDLKLAFDSFLAKVEDYWLQSPTKEPNSPLGSAYYTFWRKFNEQAQV